MEAYDAVTILSTRELRAEDGYGDIIDPEMEFDTTSIRKKWQQK